MGNLIKFISWALVLSLHGCGGGGGSSSSNTQLLQDGWPIAAALAVQNSSYENKFDGRISNTALVKFDAGINPISVTFGDFFQEGQISAFVVVNRTGMTAMAYFLRWKSSESRWVDDSARILGDGADGNRDTCINPRYAITADLNGDGKPDVYLACAKTSQTVPQVMFLSQPSGRYLHQLTGFSVDGNSVAALKINSDAFIDLIVSDSTTPPRGEPQIYLGNGTGSFTSNSSLLITSDLQSNCGGASIPSAVSGVFAVPSAAGRTDLILGSSGANNSVIWLKDLSQTASPRYSVCVSNYFPSFTDVASLTDVYGTSSGPLTTYYYLARKGASSPTTAISRVTLNEIVNGAGTSYSSQAGSHPVTLSNATSDIAEMFSLSSGGVLRAFDAGCSSQTIRCSSWQSISLSNIY
jgi:hypothetical protein